MCVPHTLTRMSLNLTINWPLSSKSQYWSFFYYKKCKILMAKNKRNCILSSCRIISFFYITEFHLQRQTVCRYLCFLDAQAGKAAVFLPRSSCFSRLTQSYWDQGSVGVGPSVAGRSVPPRWLSTDFLIFMPVHDKTPRRKTDFNVWWWQNSELKYFCLIYKHEY